jgi:hypothetical protein
MWAYYIYGIYLFLVGVIFVAPVGIAAVSGDDVLSISLGSGVVFFLIVTLGASLMAVPIARDWTGSPQRGSIVLPLIGSVLCALVVLGGAAAASLEFWGYPNKEPGDAPLILVLSVGAGGAWAAWLAALCYLSHSVDPATISGRLAQWLLGGSVLELLVAVPMHMIVCRRGECSTGILTGFAIGLGIFVMLIALGPAVFFLCYRRYKQVYSPRRNRHP